MTGIWETLNIMVSVPQWYLVAIGLVSTVVSLMAFLLVNWLSYRWALLRTGKPKSVSEKSGQPKAEVVSKSAKARKDTQSLAPAQFALSAEQERELAHRVSIGGGFTLVDTCAILGISQDTVIKKVRAGELVGYRDQDDRLWIRAQSISTLVDRTRKANPLPTQSSSPASVVKSVAIATETAPDPPVAPVQATKTKPKPPVRQHYWYQVDGGAERYSTLAEALSVIPEYKGKAIEWMKLPASIQARIQREKV